MSNQRPPLAAVNPPLHEGFGPGGGFRPDPMLPALAGQQKGGGRLGGSKVVNSPGHGNRPKQEQPPGSPPNVSKSLVERVQKSFDLGTAVVARRPAAAKSNRLVLDMRVAKAVDKYKILE
ncbi:hypothetical protein PRZ48_011342 [Zasmidium cellare]|uniref:Uncharacterized protein n=1 Tax=Zasmidium cellare TaxID=395010 RepID=A0ABR0E626_ZASCE|nr:hypothetical protein PRZ48_011342 [Zasmidium cellare]